MAEGEYWRRNRIVGALGVTQTLAWASSYYLVAILADPMAHDFGTSTTTIFTAFSTALLVSAFLGPRVGRTIDRFGGREVLAVSNLIFAGGLGVLAIAPSLSLLWIGWLSVGVGMGFGLYDAAFATLGRIFGTSARGPITGITLIAGFASTVGWPLTAWGEAEIGWRMTCLCRASAHLPLGLPLNLLLPRIRSVAPRTAEAAKPHIPIDRTMLLLSFAFAAGWVVSTAMAAHLPRILEAAGASASQAVAAAALVGPVQVAARVIEASLLRQYHPLLSTRFSTLTHPIGAGLLIAGGGWFSMPFTILHGAGNGNTDDCARNRISCRVWPGELRLPIRSDRRSCPYRPRRPRHLSSAR